MQETGAVTLADANGRFRIDQAPLSHTETRFHVSVGDLHGHTSNEVVSTHLKPGSSHGPFGSVLWSDFRKQERPPEDLPASLATVFLPVGVDGKQLVDQYVAAKGARPDQGNPIRSELPPETLVVVEAAEDLEADPFLLPQSLEDFGSGPGKTSTVLIQGALDPLPLRIESPEIGDPLADDGDQSKAVETGLVPGQSVWITGRIGDGPHGRDRSGTGDFDFYAVRDLQVDQELTVDLNTPPGSLLDSFIYIWDADGNRIDFSDDDGSSPDSYLVFSPDDPGDYYVSVAAFGSFGPVVPTESASGLGATTEGGYELLLAVEPVPDVDVYSFSLLPGDILGATVDGGPNHLTLRDAAEQVLVGSGQDLTLYQPLDSSLPTGGNASLSWVADSPGVYTLAVDGGFGEYELELAVFRPALEAGDRGQRQVLFLDFDGATLDAQSLFGFGNAQATLSPFSSFLEDFGLDPANEATVIELISEQVRANFADVAAFGGNGDFDADRTGGSFGIEILTSRESVDLYGFPLDPFGEPNVSRVVVGGTVEQLGINTIGIAESVDVGNFRTNETGVVLLDALSAPENFLSSLHRIPLVGGRTMVDLLGVAIGNVITHEAGHFFANWHTDPRNGVLDLMDQGGQLGNILGLGPDGKFGSADDVEVRFRSRSVCSQRGVYGYGEYSERDFVRTVNGNP